jgi:hypothetical protein
MRSNMTRLMWKYSTHCAGVGREPINVWKTPADEDLALVVAEADRELDGVLGVVPGGLLGEGEHQAVIAAMAARRPLTSCS